MRLAQKVLLNASALTAARLVMAGMGVVTVGIGTRYLGLDEYGQLATALAFIGIVGTLSNFGVWSVGVRELARRPDEADRVLGALLTVGFAISLLGGGIAVGLAFAIYGGSDHDLTRKAILLLLVGLPLAAPFGAINAYFVAQQKAYMGQIGSLASSVVTLALLIAAATLDWGFTGVVWAYVIAGLVQATVMGVLAYGKVRLRPSLDLALSRELLGYSLPVGGTQVLGSLYWRADIVLLSLLSSSSEVALYAVVFKIIDALMVLPNYIHVTVMPELARVASIRKRFDEIISKTLGVIVVGAAALFVLFVAFADQLTVIVAGSAFEDAAPLLRILMLVVAFAYVGGIFGDAFFVNDKQKLTFYVALFVLPVNIVLNLLLIPPWDARGAAIAWGASELVIIGIYAVLYHRFFGALPRLKRGPQILAAAGVMAAVALIPLLTPLNECGPVAVLAIGGSLSTLAYCLALYAFKAMPPEVHTNLVLPLWARLKPARSAGAKA